MCECNGTKPATPRISSEDYVDDVWEGECQEATPCPDCDGFIALGLLLLAYGLPVNFVGLLALIVLTTRLHILYTRLTSPVHTGKVPKGLEMAMAKKAKKNQVSTTLSAQSV